MATLRTSDSELPVDIWFDEGVIVQGHYQLPPPSTHPNVHREILLSLVMMMLRIGKHNVRLKELDETYRIAFHESKALNVEKKSLSPALPGGGDGEREGS